MGRKKILVVDDEEKIQKIYRDLFLSEGYNVLTSSNVVDAYEKVKFADIDLILLDINMPDIDGEVLYQLTDSFFKEKKVIICSVYSLDEQKRLIADADNYYDKSQGIDVLRMKVKKILGEE